MTEQTMTLEQAFAQAVAHHQAGRLQLAEQLYRAIQGVVPDHADTNHNLGVLAMQTGQNAAALPMLKTLHDRHPNHAQYWRSYLDALIVAGRGLEASTLLRHAKRHGLRNDAIQALQARIMSLNLHHSPQPLLAPTAVQERQLLELLGQQRVSEALPMAQMLTRQYPTHPFAWKVCAALLSQLGRNEEALQQMQTAAQLSPDDVEAHTNVGAMNQLLGRHAEAEQSYRKALALAPDHVEAHANLGIALHDLGKLDDAEASYRRAIELKPDYAKAYSNLGVTLRALRRFEDAVSAYQRAIEINPQYAEAFVNLAVAQMALRRLVDAEQSLERALALRPSYPEAHFQLGNVRLSQANANEAEACFHRALEVKPDYADAYSSLGALLREVARPSEAVQCYARAIEIDPTRAADLNNLGSLYQDQRSIDVAAELYARALVLKPDFSHALYNMGQIHELRGDMEAAREHYRRADGLGYRGASIKAGLMLPPVISSRSEMLRDRQSFEDNLDALLTQIQPIPDPLSSGGSTNFYLAYHGLNDKDLQVKVAKLYEQSCPSLMYVSPHCVSASRRKDGPTRIGFFSRYLSKHSVSICFSKLLEVASQSDEFEVTLLSCCPISEDIYAGAAGERVVLPLNLKLAHERIAGLDLDILVYLDIGMEPFSYFLAFARLAPVQCVLGGHPVTTGITNMDYFVSSGLMEPADAADHYSERLVLLDRPLYYFETPDLPTTLKSRTELSLPVDKRTYMCPMRLQKLHPDFDEAIEGILRRDPDGVVVLFEDILLPFGKQKIVDRLAMSIPAELMERVLFLPWMSERYDFMSAVAAADVIIDPFHFGIGSTSAVTSIVGTPIVTKTGEFMRGRVGTAYCTMLGIEDCIVEDVDAYVRLACDIANNAPLRDALKRQILTNNRSYYDNMAPIHELMGWFGRIGHVQAAKS